MRTGDLYLFLPRLRGTARRRRGAAQYPPRGNAQRTAPLRLPRDGAQSTAPASGDAKQKFDL
jgi:hypothetical protein